MKKIISIIGARPQFVKASLVSKKLRGKYREILVHTGQHYDLNMSDIFFKQLKIPKPKYNLGVGSGMAGWQTGKMIIEIEKILIKERPNLVIVYGDTNSTLAGSLAAAKLHIPLVHIEAGMRSGRLDMPEEVNRILTDHIASLLLCSTPTAIKNLKKEGIVKNVYLVGDIMADILCENIKLAQKHSQIIKKIKLEKGQYFLATVHRAENTDNKNNLKQILTAFSKIPNKIIFPVHPRTRGYIKSYDFENIISKSPYLTLTEPISYFDMLMLQKNALAILTDSGGIQKEAYELMVPCITMRDETEWIETVNSGWNKLTGASSRKIIDATVKLHKPAKHPNLYGKNVADKIVNIIDGKIKILKDFDAQTKKN